MISKEFLGWKLSNPRFKYQIFGVYSERNELEGYVIFYIQNNKIMLFDIGFSGNDRSYEKLLFYWLDKFVNDNNLSGIISFSQKDILFSETLKRNGFLINNTGIGPLKNKLPFMVYTDEKNATLVENIKNWAVTPVYHDSF
jgi:hypothetical protein